MEEAPFSSAIQEKVVTNSASGEEWPKQQGTMGSEEGMPQIRELDWNWGTAQKRKPAADLGTKLSFYHKSSPEIEI